MRKVAILVCLALLAIILLTAQANAAAKNWTVRIWAESNTVTAGLQPTAGSAQGTTPTIAIQDIATFYTTRIYNSGTTYPTWNSGVAWGLKVGETAPTYSSIRIGIYNQPGITLNQGLDTALYYVFGNIENTIATFATPGMRDSAAAMGLSFSNWTDIAQIMKPQGWTPTPGDLGWYYTDNTPTISSIVANWENYSFSANALPEPGSLAVLGTGLLGLAGLALRRRTA